MRLVVASVLALALLPAGATQGRARSGGETHDYVFTLYALDEATGLDGGATVDDLRAVMEGHVLDEAVLTAPYSRSSR